MGRALKQDGRAAKVGGRAATVECDQCCGPVVCAFSKYSPCVRTPFYECPIPDPVYVTNCWKCTSGTSRQTIIDPNGFCWFFEDGPYLPDPGTGEDPPAGYQWIPEGAVVWDQIEGPCATGGCADPECRTFDQFVPARKCPCSTGSGPDIKYFRCHDVSGLTGCVVDRDGDDCYELARDLPSVPGPIDPSLLLGPSVFSGSCCECCDTIADNPCEGGTMPIRTIDACPWIEESGSVPVCCEDGTTIQIGYGIVREYFLQPWPCPPNVLEHWWRYDSDGGTLNWRYQRYNDPGTCAPEVETGSRPLSGRVECETFLRWELPPGFGGGLGIGFCPTDCPNFYRRRENALGGIIVGRSYWPSPGCQIAFDSSAAIVRTSASAVCAGGCNQLGRRLPPIPNPPAGGNSPADLGFTLGRSRGPDGRVYEVVRHRSLPSILAPSPSVVLANSTFTNQSNSGGCAGCRGDGGL